MVPQAAADDPDFRISRPSPVRPARSPAYHPAMLLALDIGNTNVTVGLFRAGALLATRRAATTRGRRPTSSSSLLDGLLRLDGIAIADARRDRAGVGRAGADRRRSRRSPSDATGRSLVAEAGTVPLAVRVDRPDDVGADRLVNALAAARLHGTPAVVVDFGTATTLDCVASDGAYVGGAIAPGLELGLEALAARTAKLPRIELRAPDRAIGRDTVRPCSPARSSATRRSRRVSCRVSGPSWPTPTMSRPPTCGRS